MSSENGASVAQRKQRWQEFYSADTGRNRLFLINYQPDALERPPLWPDKKQERIKWALRDYERQLARTEWLDDDSIPCLNVATGTEIFAEAFGCKVFRPEDNMPFALPLVSNAAEAAKLGVPEVWSTPLAMLFEIADELRRRAGSEAVVKVVDLQCPLDTVNLIWDKSACMMAMIDEPAAIMELATKVRTLMITFLDEWFSRYGSEFIAHYPSYYMPDGVTFSVDEVGCVNADMFAEFFLPELASMSERYGGVGIHCCANARHQWDGFKQVPGLRLLNLVQPPDVLSEAYVFFAEHVAQMHCDARTLADGSQPETWSARYPDEARVVIQASAESRDEALRISEALIRTCR